MVSKTHGNRLTEGVNALAGLSDLDLVDLEVTFSPGEAEHVVFYLPRVSVQYYVKQQVLFHTSMDKQGKLQSDYWTLDQLPHRDGKVALRLLVDRLTLEAFAFEGSTFAAHYIHPDRGPMTMSIHAIGGTAQIHALTVRQLHSGWKE